MHPRDELYKSNTSFKLLRNSLNSGAVVNLLLDDKGYIQATGIIKSIHIEDRIPFMELKSGMKIALKTVVGINTIFSHRLSTPSKINS